jgi:ubiquinone/menaquinone biosynthesis C-methylase UbiE
MSQRFNADTQALKEREKVNATGAVHNLESWIIGQVHPRAGIRVLDLGCGTGKQVFAFAKLVTPEGSIVGVDISKEAVDTVNERARREELPYVSAIQSSLDNVLERLGSERFDLIVSSYAFYYSTDMRRLFTGLRSILKADGQIFVCGPGDGTNQEMIDMMNRFLPPRFDKALPIKDFMDNSDLAAFAPLYAKIATTRLQNQIKFPAPEPVLQWWRNHNSYAPEIDGAMAQAILAHFENHTEFVLSKNVLGVHGHV